MIVSERISRYSVVEKLGSGMGVVNEAEGVELGRRVALKFLPESLESDPKGTKRSAK